MSQSDHSFERFSKVVGALKAEDLLDCTSVSETSEFTQSYADQWTATYQNTITAKGSLSQYDKYLKVGEQLNKDENLKNFQFTFKLKKGDNLPSFQNLTDVFTENKTDLAHRPGEVLLIDVWATWCGPCQKPMQHNQKMLESNPEWKDKARIVAVSVDDQLQPIKKRVQTKKWDKIEHLTLLGWDHGHNLIKYFGIRGIPFVCLINKKGQIDFTGHPSETDLEKRINQLIKSDEQGAEGQKEQEKESGAKQSGESIGQDTHKKILANLNKIKQEGKGLSVTFSLPVTRKLLDGKQSYDYGKLRISGVATKEEADLYKSIMKLVLEGLPDSAYTNESYINDPQLQLEQHNAHFTSLAEKYNIPKPYGIEAIQITGLKDQQWTTKKCIKYPGVVLHKDISIEKYGQLVQAIHAYIEKVQERDTSGIQTIVKQQVPLALEGNPYPVFNNLKNASTNQVTSLKVKEGRVELITFYIVPRISQSFSQELISAAKSSGRTDIHISFLTGPELCPQLQKLQQQNPELITVYLNAHQSPELKTLLSNVSQYLIVVDEKGIIRKARKVSVPELPKIVSPSEPQNKENTATAEQIASLTAILKGEDMQKLKEKAKEFDYEPKFQLSYQQNLVTKEFTRPTASIHIRKSDLQHFQPIIDALQKVATVKLDLVETFKIPSGKTCETCKGQLKLPYYYYRSSETFRCPACAQKVDETSTDLLNKYVVKDNGVLIFKDESEVDTLRFGKNIQPTTNEEARVPNFFCNGCRSGNSDGPRYICMGCRREPNPSDYVDFCVKCARALQGQDEANKEAVLKTSQGDGHKWDHPLYRINYSPKGYYDF